MPPRTPCGTPTPDKDSCIYHNKRGGDCAPWAAKFMEMHCNGDGKEEMSLITDRVVDKIREQYAMDCYEEFVGDYRVANEAI
ncbi:hypothetical protein F2Q70_00024871 [Brassica cretica]|uniref:Ubiquitin-like protease family profile domain-containing protein n=1 Tax=Brassica cretica TaxID=69181 RepID=A0A8S9LEF3_BRACR|nr:hypothetical protein F2Q70_00024871 [Brassica cretica]